MIDFKFDKPEFLQSLQSILAEAVDERGLSGYDPQIAVKLQQKAVEVSKNYLPPIEASAIMEPKQIRSARFIVKSAAKLASDAKRGIISVEDIQQAISDNFCNVWPFCCKEDKEK